MSTPSEALLARTRDELRAEAEAIRMRLPAGPPAEPMRVVAASAVAPAPVDEAKRLDYSIDELCAENYTLFVERAFHALIRRPVEPDTRSALIRRMAAGVSKVEILGDLRYSPEGRAVGARIPGLRRAYLLAKLFNIPFAGFVAEWFFCIARLPTQARQQRAQETYQAGRVHVLGEQCAVIGQRLAAIVGEQAALAKRVAAMAGGEDGLRSLVDAQTRQLERIEDLSRQVRAVSEEQAGSVRAAQVAELAERVDALVVRAGDANEDYRRMVLGMNHWLTMLRSNLAELESSAAPKAD